MYGNWKDTFLDLIFPRTCAACLLDIPPPLGGPLCGDCLLRLRTWDGPSLRLDGLEIWPTFPYHRPLPELLKTFKYRGRLSVGLALADWMAGAFARLPRNRVDVVVPVPLHPNRLRERGFNQAEVLARAVARVARVPMTQLLERSRNTAPQWRLGKTQRAENLRAAFRPLSGKALSPARPVSSESTLWLIDDVCTTGGTLLGCARALREAGYRKIHAFVLAQD